MTWIPIGPFSTQVDPMSPPIVSPVTGRIRCLAVDSTGSRVYAGSTTGGLFRLDGPGSEWLPLTDGVRLDPLPPGAAPLACGALAVDPADPDRVFVGTGDYGLEYTGVGVLASTTGGIGPWTIEEAAPGSPPFTGHSFLGLAIDPALPDRVVGSATFAGIYRREPDGAGGFHWVHQPSAGLCSDVVAVHGGGATRFYAARVTDGGAVPSAVLVSPDGASWNPLGTGFPTDRAAIRLGVQPDNPNLLYALATDSTRHVYGIYRLDPPDPTWRPLGPLPADAFLGQTPISLAVDPLNADRIVWGNVPLYASKVVAGAGGYTLVPTPIPHVHNDHWALAYVPGDSNRLWIGGDGGVSFSGAAATDPVAVESRSAGLPAIQSLSLGLHPQEDAVLYCGTQDNDLLRYDGDEVWLNLGNMDAGNVVVNWGDPYKVLCNALAEVFHRATDGGQGLLSWTDVDLPPGPEGYLALAGTPDDPTRSSLPDRVAVGATRLWLSDVFGGAWTSLPHGDATDELGGEQYNAVAFASDSILHAATTATVYRFTEAGGSWSRTALPALPLASAVVGAIAVDWADPSGTSLYVGLYSAPDYRRLWHWDGAAWTARSGPSAGDPASLPEMLVEALAVDPDHPSELYVGSSAGVWRSPDGGVSWEPWSDDLPQVPVKALAVHRARRTVFAATYGRGVYERRVDGYVRPATELYIRDTSLDVGKRPTVDGLPDPRHRGSRLYHWDGPDIKVDAPAADGSYQLTPPLDPYRFAAELVDMSGSVETAAPASPPVVNRVYVQVHNRGSAPANGHVAVYLANASVHLPDLPSGYAAAVQAGAPIGGAWSFVGSAPFTGLHTGFPQVLELDLPSTLLPPPAGLPGNRHWCLLALAHGPDDPFTATEPHTDALTLADRKATNKNLNVAGGTAGRWTPERWAPVHLYAVSHSTGLAALVLDLRGVPGEAHVYLPPPLAPFVRKGVQRAAEVPKLAMVQRRIADVAELIERKGCEPTRGKEMLAALAAVEGEPPFLLPGGRAHALLAPVKAEPGLVGTMFVAFCLPTTTPKGATFEATLRTDGRKDGGGMTWRIQAPTEDRRG